MDQQMMENRFAKNITDQLKILILKRAARKHARQHAIIQCKIKSIT